MRIGVTPGFDDDETYFTITARGPKGRQAARGVANRAAQTLGKDNVLYSSGSEPTSRRQKVTLEGSVYRKGVQPKQVANALKSARRQRRWWRKS